MSNIKKLTISLGLLGLAGYSVYYFLLNDRAKEALKKNTKSISDNIIATVADYKEAEQNNSIIDIRQNQERTLQEWKSLGF